MRSFTIAVQAIGWIGLLATAFTLWAPIEVPALSNQTGVFPFWPWSGIVLLLSAAGFLVKRAFRGPIRGRWQLWCFVAAIAFVIAGAIRILLPATEYSLAIGPILLGVSLGLLATETVQLDG